MPRLMTTLWLTGGISLVVVLGLAAIIYRPRFIAGPAMRVMIIAPLAVLLGFLTLYIGPKHYTPCIHQNAFEWRFFGQYGHIDTDGTEPELCKAPHPASYAASVTVTLLILAHAIRRIRASGDTTTQAS